MRYPMPPPDDSRSLDELICVALGDPEDESCWEAVVTLHYRGTREVLERAAALCHSGCPNERQLGADILGQLGVPERVFPAESVRILLDMLISERDASVLQSIFVAFSHIGDAAAIDPAIQFASHDDADVRHAVVLALTSHDDAWAIRKLIELTHDPVAEVRDWATFALGSQREEVDTHELREALAARLTDTDEYVRGEALIGLARRKDARAIPALQTELALSDVNYLAVEAAELAADPSLLRQLLELQSWWTIDPPGLEAAIAACTPAG